MTACPPTWGPQQWSTFRKASMSERDGRGGSRRRLHYRASCASNDRRTEAQRSVSTAKATRRRSRSAFHVLTSGGYWTRSALHRELSRFKLWGRSHTAASPTAKAAPCQVTGSRASDL